MIKFFFSRLEGPDPAYQRCHIELTAGKKGQNPLPDWPVMAETSLKSDIFLNQWIQIEIEWLRTPRSEEHTSELQSRGHLVCRLLLEKKKTKSQHKRIST